MQVMTAMKPSHDWVGSASNFEAQVASPLDVSFFKLKP